MAKKKRVRKKKTNPENLKKPQYRGLKPWKEGQSGNPAGRPKTIPKLDVLLRQALGTTSENPEESVIFKIIKSLAEDAVDKKSRHKSKAAEILLERSFGKPEAIKDDTPPEKMEKNIQIITDDKRIEELMKTETKPK